MTEIDGATFALSKSSATPVFVAIPGRYALRFTFEFPPEISGVVAWDAAPRYLFTNAIRRALLRMRDELGYLPTVIEYADLQKFSPEPLGADQI